ncbi:cupin domain-containing protein [Pseudonocardia sp.]|uniref:cupin domain-containing protein n=1 Tax=Pseudonocardia sp. TaxID=60912 RepID=UPI003D142F01
MFTTLPDAGVRLDMIDGVHVAKVRPEHTGGVYEVFEVLAEPAPAAPPHAAPWAASLHLLDGTLTVRAGGRVHRVAPGDTVTLPAHTAYTVDVQDGAARFVAVTTGTGAGRFFADAVAAGPDIGAVVAAAARHGVSIGPGGGQVHLAPGAGPGVTVPAEHTGGVYEIHEITTPVGPTRLPWPRTLYVLGGTLTGRVGDEDVELAEGGTVTVPAGVAHAFDAAGALLLSITAGSWT